MGESELTIELSVILWAKRNGFVVLKLNNPASRGWPDRLFIAPSGAHIYIEFKKPGGAVRKLQVGRKERLERNNCEVHIIDNRYNAIGVLSAHLET